MRCNVLSGELPRCHDCTSRIGFLGGRQRAASARREHGRQAEQQVRVCLLPQQQQQQQGHARRADARVLQADHSRKLE